MPPLFPSWRDVHEVNVKLDALLKEHGVELANEAFIIKQEHEIMTTAQDLDDQSKQILAKANSEGDAITAIAGVVTDIKAQNATLIQELADAQASGDQAAIDEAMANLTAANAKLDANALAEAAINGTTPPAGTGTGGTTPPNPPANGPGPVVTGISPAVGPEAGGTSISISGSGFAVTDSVSVGGNPATGVVINNDASITAIVPAGTGDASVVVSDGTNSSAPAVFRYVAAPPATPGA